MPFTLMLQSNDGQQFLVEDDVASHSILLKNMILDLGLEDSDSATLSNPIPMLFTDGWTLNKILDWCREYRGEEIEAKEGSNVLSPWDTDYLNVTGSQLVDLIKGADYMNVPGLIDIICQKIADIAQGKSVEQMREVFGLTDDLTDEEKIALKARYAVFDL